MLRPSPEQRAAIEAAAKARGERVPDMLLRLGLEEAARPVVPKP